MARKDTLQKVVVFALTFFAYAGLHCLREGWSYSKPEITKAFPKITTTQLGIVDTCYLVSYSFGMATIGNLSSKVNLKYFIAGGMVLSTIFYMSFSFYYLISHAFSYAFLIVVMCLNGFFQSTGWPGVMAVAGNWFGKGKRGLLMGFWAINANVGNIIASVLCNILEEEEHLAWTYNFFFTGGFALLVAILILFFLQEKPSREHKIPLRETLTE